MSDRLNEQQPPHQAPDRRLRLVRVKRKRGAEAPEDLVVEGLGAPSKRAHISLSSVMVGLGLAPQQDPEPGSGEAEPDVEAPPPLAARRQRYRKLSTLSALQLRSMNQQQLDSLMAEQQQAAAARRAGVKDSSAAGGAAAAAASAAAARAAQQLQAGQAARYEQIKRRRGLSNFSVTEHAADPLGELAAVYDVVRRDADSGPGSSAATALPAGGPSSGGSAAVRRPSKAQRAAQQYDEGTLMCNYMPMIREYLASQGRDVPEPGSAGGAASGDTPAAAGAAAAAAGQQGQQGAEGVGAEEQEEEDEYVYDLYAAMSDDESEAAAAGAEEEQWRELHARGCAPVVQITEDGTWLVLEQEDGEESGADSEDSNAEGFYAHDYPDEASNLGSSSEDGGHDPEGAVFHRGAGASGAGGQRNEHRSWDERSYGYGSGGSDY